MGFLQRLALLFLEKQPLFISNGQVSVKMPIEQLPKQGEEDAAEHGHQQDGH